MPIDATLPLIARFLEAGGHAEGADEELLVSTFSRHSPYLMELLIAAPARLEEAVKPPFLRRLKDKGTMRQELATMIDRGAADGSVSLDDALRRYRNQEYVRLGARELADLGSFEDISAELSHLADVCFEAAMGTAAAAPFVTFAMGKHGGEELNFCSDVDVIYVYGEGDGADDPSAHAHFTKLAEDITRRVAEPSREGYCFRVDLRLRPEGGAGPMVNSVAALERYYESWGRVWERQAWLRARGAAGDERLATEVLDMLRPFIYPRNVGPHFMDDIRGLLGQAQAQRRAASDVKLGPGGIREVEFFAQALQLLHAGKQPALRERHTLDALDKLLFAGLISDKEHQTLTSALIFLRRLEHRIQLYHGSQTHELPSEPGRFAQIASAMGFASTTAFLKRLETHRRDVRRLWTTLGIAESSQTVIDFGQVAFRDKSAAIDRVTRLYTSPSSPFSPSAPPDIAELAPVLVSELSECPDPDQALSHLSDFTQRVGRMEPVWRTLLAERSRAKLLISLFGTSEFLARRLIARPDLLDELLVLGHRPRRSRADLTRTIADRLAGGVYGQLLLPDGTSTEGAGDGGDFYEHNLSELRRFKQEEELRVGLLEIAGLLGEGEASRELSVLAEAILEAAFRMVVPDPNVPLVVVALGKLGASEIDFASDLDLLFVHGGDALEDHERMAKLAQRFISVLTVVLAEGRLYEIDVRLRPSGRHGMLVTTLPSFVAYHDHSTGGQGALWERQALLKARVVCGHEKLGEAFEAARQHIVFDAPLPANANLEIHRLRMRMQAELSGTAAFKNRGESPALANAISAWDFKFGRGGIVDIEFAAQLLQLRHGRSVPDARVRGTEAALDALLRYYVLDPDSHGLLVRSYHFLRKLENRIRIVHDRAGTVLRAPTQLLPGKSPSSTAAPQGDPAEVDAERKAATGASAVATAAAELDKLARRMGYRNSDVTAGQSLIADYLKLRDRVRKQYQLIFGVNDGPG